MTPTEHLAALGRLRDRMLADGITQDSLDAFACEAVALAESARQAASLTAEQRHEAGRVARGPYMDLCRRISSGAAYSLGTPAGDETAEDVALGPQIMLDDGARFNAAGFIRRIHADWQRAIG